VNHECVNGKTNAEDLRGPVKATETNQVNTLSSSFKRQLRALFTVYTSTVFSLLFTCFVLFT